MLNLLAPHSRPRTDEAYREDIRQLCLVLCDPGLAVPAGADRSLAEALLSREIDSGKLVEAALCLLQRNSQVESILQLAWDQNEEGLDLLLANGTLIAFLNAPLIQALLYSSTIPNLSFDRLFSHIRKRLLGCALDPDWSSTPETLKATVALAAHAFLAEYIFQDSPEERGSLRELCRRVEEAGGTGVETFDVAVVGCYKALNALNTEKVLAALPELQTNPALQVLWRIHVTEPENERRLVSAIPRLTNIQDEISKNVRAMYEENPYPRWVSYMMNDPLPPEVILSEVGISADPSLFNEHEELDVLVAGCGTGLAAIMDAVLWRNANVHAIDLSLSSLAFGKRCADDLGLASITFAQADILELPTLGRSYDYISSSGVLHHMADPIAGWQALSEVCRPGGLMRLCVYSEASRRAVRNSGSFVRAFSGGQSASDIREVRQRLIDHAHWSGEPDDQFSAVFRRFDFYSLSMFRDLLMHVQDFEFTIPKIRDAIDQLGLQFCGFVDSDKTLLPKYRAFNGNDPDGLDLESWDRFEAEQPDTFAKMYDFMVQKPL